MILMLVMMMLAVDNLSFPFFIIKKETKIVQKKKKNNTGKRTKLSVEQLFFHNVKVKCYIDQIITTYITYT
jgi:spore germination protein GerM